MRFLDTTTCQFVERDPKEVKYAILSHTWDKNGEQTFQELRQIQDKYYGPPKPGTSTSEPLLGSKDGDG